MNSPHSLRGVLTPLVTPFRNECVDEAGISRLVEAQIVAGVAGLVLCGVHGEGFSLSIAERERVISVAASTARGRVPILAEVGTNATAHSIAHAKTALQCGASAVVLPVPYYNRPNQEGIRRHFRAVSDATGAAGFLSSCVERSGIDVGAATLGELHASKDMLGFIEASANIERLAHLRSDAGSDVPIWLANDVVLTNCLGLRVEGFVSAIGNLVPRACVLLARQTRDSNLASAGRLLDVLAPLAAMTTGPEEIARLKYAVTCLDATLDASPRLPLLTFSDDRSAWSDRLLRIVEKILQAAAGLESNLWSTR